MNGLFWKRKPLYKTRWLPACRNKCIWIIFRVWWFGICCVKPQVRMRVYFLFSVAVFIEWPGLAAWFSSSLFEVKGKKEAILQQVYLAPQLDDSMKTLLCSTVSVCCTGMQRKMWAPPSEIVTQVQQPGGKLAQRRKNYLKISLLILLARMKTTNPLTVNDLYRKIN